MASIDQKLLRIVLEASPRTFRTGRQLAESIASKKSEEFSYVRDDKKRHSSWQSIVKYVGFAKRIGLLRSDLSRDSPPTWDMGDFEGFKGWAGDKLVRYSTDQGFGPDKLKNTVLRLTREKRLPTALAMRSVLCPRFPVDSFRWCLQLQAVLREATLKIYRGWLWLPPDTLSDE